MKFKIYFKFRAFRTIKCRLLELLNKFERINKHVNETSYLKKFIFSISLISQ